MKNTKKFTIQTVKIGKMINVSLNGKLYKKVCNTAEEANNFFATVLKAKQNPTEDNIKEVKMVLNKRLRVAYLVGLEHDPETGDAFLAGFNTPIPAKLLEVIEEYHNNKFPLDPIINFWKLLMINPDKLIRDRLFDFISKHDFALTDNGYLVVYKAVHRNNKKDKFNEFVNQQFLHVRKTWKSNPKNYVVYKNEDGDFAITKVKTAETWKKTKKDFKVLGNLYALFNKASNKKKGKLSYTDKHTKKMNITVGKPVYMNRENCDSNPSNECSYGLHVGATSYVESFAYSGDAVLVCFVNPAHVVAVPNYDRSKMRVTEYFPFAVAKYDNGKVDVVEEKYFENDYVEYEEKQLEIMVNTIKKEELPMKTAKNAAKDERSMSELMKIINARMVDIK